MSRSIQSRSIRVSSIKTQAMKTSIKILPIRDQAYQDQAYRDQAYREQLHREQVHREQAEQAHREQERLERSRHEQAYYDQARQDQARATGRNKRRRTQNNSSRYPARPGNRRPTASWRRTASSAASSACKVVKGVSLYVSRGEAVGLLGPNGAGKTTVFYMITGLITADRGRIELDGHDVTALPMYQRARLGIGYLPQEASIFHAVLSVEENIRAVLRVVEPSKKRREYDLDLPCSRSSTSPACARRPRSRCPAASAAAVEIARALASAAELHAARRALRRHRPDRGRRHSGAGRHLDPARHRCADHHDHNVRETLGLTDRAYIIYSGEVLMEGRAEDIVNNPDVRRLYLGDNFSM